MSGSGVGKLKRIAYHININALVSSHVRDMYLSLSRIVNVRLYIVTLRQRFIDLAYIAAWGVRAGGCCSLGSRSLGAGAVQ